MLKANRNPKYQIKECDKEFYHVLLISNIHIPKEHRYELKEDIQIYDKRGYKQLKTYKHVLGFDSEELIHIPQSEFDKIEAAKKAVETAKHEAEKKAVKEKKDAEAKKAEAPKKAKEKAK